LVSANQRLLAIVEQGGYPNFTSLYEQCGFNVTMEHSMRKAIAFVTKEKPAVIVAEFNHQSDFRDRTSSLESLLATVQRLQHSAGVQSRVIVFYEKEYQHQLDKLRTMFDNFESMPYPIDPDELQQRCA